MTATMIVTIDGPAGSGKSTAATALAARLGFDYLDTGAMYRAVALAFTRRGVDLADPDAVAAALAGLAVEVPPGRVLLDGEDVTAAARTPEVSQAASRAAVVPAVRRFLVAEQRRVAAGRNVIAEGRDQGTAVFPDAGCKFFLTADARARAERRHRELLDKGLDIPLGDVLADMMERDHRDSTRADSPLCRPDDAVLIDTTDLPPDAVVARMEAEVRRRCPTAHP
jgi:cytidylate kinase